MPDRVAVAFSMDQVRCRLGAFETAWAAPPVSQQRVLVLRCGGAGIQEVAQRLELTPATCGNTRSASWRRCVWPPARATSWRCAGSMATAGRCRIVTSR